MQLQQLEFALSSYMDPDAALKLDSDITEGLLTLRGSLSRSLLLGSRLCIDLGGKLSKGKVLTEPEQIAEIENVK